MVVFFFNDLAKKAKGVLSQAKHCCSSTSTQPPPTRTHKHFTPPLAGTHTTNQSINFYFQTAESHRPVFQKRFHN